MKTLSRVNSPPPAPLVSINPHYAPKKNSGPHSGLICSCCKHGKKLVLFHHCSHDDVSHDGSLKIDWLTLLVPSSLCTLDNCRVQHHLFFICTHDPRAKKVRERKRERENPGIQVFSFVPLSVLGSKASITRYKNPLHAAPAILDLHLFCWILSFVQLRLCEKLQCLFSPCIFKPLALWGKSCEMEVKQTTSKRNKTNLFEGWEAIYHLSQSKVFSLTIHQWHLSDVSTPVGYSKVSALFPHSARGWGLECIWLGIYV